MTRHICMIHLPQMYLGSVAIELEDDLCVVEYVEGLFDVFKETGLNPTEFINWLVQDKNLATEESWCDEAPNLPMQVYLNPVEVATLKSVLDLITKQTFADWYNDGEFAEWLQDSTLGHTENDMLNWLRKRTKSK